MSSKERTCTESTGITTGASEDPCKFEARWNNPERDHWQHPEEIVAALALTPGATVADVGAGTGYLVAHLSEAVGRSGTVIAIDMEQAMVTYLTSHKREAGTCQDCAAEGKRSES